MNVLNFYYLYLNNSNYINISEFIRIKHLEEIKEVEKMFDNESLSEINKGIIIPMKYSHKILFTSSVFEDSKVKEYQKTFEVMPHIKDIEYYWSFCSNYDLADKYLLLLHARTKYFLFIDLKISPDFDEELKMLNWNNKRIYAIHFLTLSDENYSFVVFLLGIQKVQECLNSIELATQNLTNCLKIMELLLKCRSIDSIKLQYLTSDVDNEEEVIRESVQELIKQVGLINTIVITKC